MTIDFYYSELSPPCRAVQLLADYIGLSLNLKPLEMMEKKEHLSKEFVKINPQHCVPTIVDGDFALWESRAIMCYLVEQHAKTDVLYPKDPATRGKIDHLLYFDMGTLWDSLYSFSIPVLREGKKADQSKLDKVYASLEFFEQFLDGHLFAVGNRLTVADFALVTTVALIDALNINLQKYPKVSSWFHRCKRQIPGYDRVNKVADETLRTMGKGKFRT